MPLVRWLVPIVTVLALVVQSIGTYASAGVTVEVTCCCPDIETCKCHDHDDDQPIDKMKRCAGAVDIDTPVAHNIVFPAPTATAVPVRRATPIAWSPAAIPADRTIVPEKPPF